MYRKIFPVVFLSFMFCCFLSSTGAYANIKLVILEVTGILEKVDESADPPLIYLKVDEGTASSPLNKHCLFMDDRGTELSGRDFVKRYAGKKVTLEIYEQSGEVVSCKAER